MASATYEHEFTWSGHAENVIATGTFDKWSSSLPLVKGTDGKFSAKLGLPYGEKIDYKYVVDGTWLHNPDEPMEKDAEGNANNVITTPAAPAASEDHKEVEHVAEAVVPVAAGAGIAAVAIPVVNESSPTVVPAPTPSVGEASPLSVPTIPSSQNILESVAVKEPITDGKASPPVVTSASPTVEEPKKEESSLPFLGAVVAGVGAVAATAAIVVEKVTATAAPVIATAVTTTEEATIKVAAELKEESKPSLPTATTAIKADAEPSTAFGTSTMAALDKAAQGPTTATSAPVAAAKEIAAPIVESAPVPLQVLNEPSANTVASPIKEVVEKSVPAPDVVSTPIPVEEAPAPVAEPTVAAVAPSTPTKSAPAKTASPSTLPQSTLPPSTPTKDVSATPAAVVDSPAATLPAPIVSPEAPSAPVKQLAGKKSTIGNFSAVGGSNGPSDASPAVTRSKKISMFGKLKMALTPKKGSA